MLSPVHRQTSSAFARCALSSNMLTILSVDGWCDRYSLRMRAEYMVGTFCEAHTCQKRPRNQMLKRIRKVRCHVMCAEPVGRRRAILTSTAHCHRHIARGTLATTFSLWLPSYSWRPSTLACGFITARTGTLIVDRHRVCAAALCFSARALTPYFAGDAVVTARNPDCDPAGAASREAGGSGYRV